MNNFMEIMQFAILALGCFILALLLKTNRDRILQITTDLINKAEDAVQGSGMGAEKKALVMAQLEAAGVHVNTWLAAQIDAIVQMLNTNGAWLAAQTRQHTDSLTEEGQ